MTKITPKWLTDNLKGISMAGRSKDGTFTLRKEFYWGFGEADIWVQGIRNQLRDLGVAFMVLESGSKLKPFKGGGNARQNSHYWMKIRILG
jgi:hypothetical protein